MSVETVARRYAAALADVVIKTNEIDSVKSELKTWEQMINANSDLQTAFRNPAISHDNKEKVLENLIEKHSRRARPPTFCAFCLETAV